MGANRKPLFNFSADDVTKAFAPQQLSPSTTAPGFRPSITSQGEHAPYGNTPYILASSGMHPVQKERIAMATALSKTVHEANKRLRPGASERHRLTPAAALLTPQPSGYLVPFREKIRQLSGTDLAGLIHAVEQTHVHAGSHNLEALHEELQRVPERKAPPGNYKQNSWGHLTAIARETPGSLSDDVPTVKGGVHALLGSSFVEAPHIIRQQAVPTRSAGSESSSIA